MVRIARAVAAGYPHHVLQWGNNKADVFMDDKDSLVYLYLLKKYADKYSCPVLAYCLMPNHVHLLLKPARDVFLSKTMQGLSLSYAQYFNKKHNKSGRLWESRYYSCIVDKENYLWTVARYIEQNPKRSGLVGIEERYPYSSARAHIASIDDGILGEEIFGDEGRSEYIDFLHRPVRYEEVDKISYCTRSGVPFGNEAFVKAMGQSLGIDLVKRPRGRPGKKAILE
ncbi:transposase IS200 like protein [bacterium BMS3Abin10]|nr:transposase IS200 like protein [bacterium BMS3Abin10]